jgi:hypothetical protein
MSWIGLHEHDDDEPPSDAPLNPLVGRGPTSTPSWMGAGPPSESHHWEHRLAPQTPNLPKLFGSIVDENYSFEYLVNPDDLGACAMHMEWQEPYTVHTCWVEP